MTGDRPDPDDLYRERFGTSARFTPPQRGTMSEITKSRRTGVTLGDLRELVAVADTMNFPDTAAIYARGKVEWKGHRDPLALRVTVANTEGEDQ